ncbi:MAG: hypothetical protein ACRD4B_02740, partial [Acidobacteriota bacterium]
MSFVGVSACFLCYNENGEYFMAKRSQSRAMSKAGGAWRRRSKVASDDIKIGAEAPMLKCGNVSYYAGYFRRRVA